MDENRDDLKKRAKTMASTFRRNTEKMDHYFLLSELLDNELLDKRFSFEESLIIISLALKEIQEHTEPLTVNEKIEAVMKREYEYKREFYTCDDLVLKTGYVESTLIDVCKNEGVELADFLNHLKRNVG